MTPRLFWLILLLAVSIVIVVVANGAHTFLGLGALSWIGVWAGGVIIHLILQNEWPAYSARKAA